MGNYLVLKSSNNNPLFYEYNKVVKPKGRNQIKFDYSVDEIDFL